MENKYDEQLITMQVAIKDNKQEMISNKQDSDEKMTKFKEEIKTILTEITNQINNLKYSPA